MRARAIALFVGALAACSAQRGATREPIVAPGTSAPNFTANRLDRGHMELSSLRGQVVVLNVWAAWCVGCEKDLPLLDAMATRLEGAGVKVVAVSLDSSRARIDPLANSRVWRLTMLHDPTGRVGDLYQATMPALYLIDRGGTVRHSYVGLRAEQLEGIERQARALSQ